MSSEEKGLHGKINLLEEERGLGGSTEVFSFEDLHGPKGRPKNQGLEYSSTRVMPDVPSPLRTTTPPQAPKEGKGPGHQGPAQVRGNILFSLSGTEEKLEGLLDPPLITKVNRALAVWYSKGDAGLEKEILVFLQILA